MSKPTIKDVARLANVSPMAVSLAIRNKPGVSEATRRNILSIIEQIGYKKSPYVAALMTSIREGRQPKGQPVIAYINFHPGYIEDNPKSYGPYIPSILERCQQLGFSLSVFQGNIPDLSAKRLSQILRARGIQGVVVGPAIGMQGRFDLDWKLFSSALIGYSIQQPPLHRAVNHQSHTVRLALHSLTKLGYSRIGLVTYRRDERRVDYNWVAGWASFYYEQEKRPPAPIFSVDKEDTATPDRLLKWIQKHRPDAILSANSITMQSLKALGIRVPKDIAYAVCNCATDTTKPTQISGIDQNTRQVAHEAVNLVVQQLLNNEVGIPATARTVMVEGNWVQGTSTPRVK